MLKDIASNQVTYLVTEASLVMCDHLTSKSQATSKVTSSTHTNIVQATSHLSNQPTAFRTLRLLQQPEKATGGPLCKRPDEACK